MGKRGRLGCSLQNGHVDWLEPVLSEQGAPMLFALTYESACKRMNQYSLLFFLWLCRILMEPFEKISTVFDG